MANYNITGAKTPLKPMVFELDINNSPPPFVLLINPSSLDLKFTPKVNEQRVRWADRRESAYVFQVHHDELDILSAEGKSAMFYTHRGITSADRTQTLGWENIQRLLAIYRNNGMNFNSKPGRKGSAVIESVGRVIIVYDDFLYRGSFESFQLNEASDKPFQLDFSFDFKVTRIFNIRGVSENLMNNILQADPRFSRS